jgi:putative regulatory protein, FmdB family
MPTYDYHCLKCEKDFEVFQSMKDSAFKTCPEAQCQVSPWGRGKVKRLLGTGAGLIFKGSGFYTTDYRSEGYKQAAKQESGGGGRKAKRRTNRRRLLRPPPGGSTSPSPAASPSAGSGSQ